MTEKLFIEHNYEEGTLVHGTTKNSAAHQELKDHRSWKWSGYAGAWTLRSSRTRRAKRGHIEQMADILRRAGYEVEVTIDDAMPDMAQREQDLSERMDDRAAALHNKADRQAGTAATWQRKSDSQPLPPGGEPIKVGHHSERRHRRALEKSWDYMGRAVQAREQAIRTTDRATSAEHHMGARYNPTTVANRIKKFEKRERDLLKDWDGRMGHLEHDDGTVEYGRIVPTAEKRECIEADLAEVREKLQWWRQVRADQLASGKALDIGPHNVQVGDWVSVRGKWVPVRRVNKKSASVADPGVSFYVPGEKESTITQPWHKIHRHRKAADVPAEVVEAFENRLTPLPPRQ